MAPQLRAFRTAFPVLTRVSWMRLYGRALRLSVARLNTGARKIDANNLVPGPSADVYAFYRVTIQRNLYRIPIP